MSYGYIPSVTYWNRFKDKAKKHVSAACFSSYNQSYYSKEKANKDLTKIYYKCPIDPSLTGEEIDFYLKFVRAILPKNIFKVRRIKDNNFLFILDARTIVGSQKILSFLSYFRYVNEFPEIIKDFYLNKSEKLADNFIAFQKSHSVKLVKYPYGKSIHCVKPNGNSPVSYKTWKSRNKEFSLNSVNAYFAPEAEQNSAAAPAVEQF